MTTDYRPHPFNDRRILSLISIPGPHGLATHGFSGQLLFEHGPIVDRAFCMDQSYQSSRRLHLDGKWKFGKYASKTRLLSVVSALEPGPTVFNPIFYLDCRST